MSDAAPEGLLSKLSEAKLAAISAQLKYQFNDSRLLRQALTHRSFSATHNERLEFLGDAVLDLAVSDWLMQRQPDASEGELSRLRAHLVREASLYEFAVRLGLPAVLQLGDGERKAGGQQKPSILADALEALLGAVYRDGGYAPAREAVAGLLENVDICLATRSAKDAKTALQEWLQARRLALPSYELVQVQGAEHAQLFTVRCAVAVKNLAELGNGASRKAAEQAAAAKVLEQLSKD